MTQQELRQELVVMFNGIADMIRLQRSDFEWIVSDDGETLTLGRDELAEQVANRTARGVMFVNMLLEDTLRQIKAEPIQ